MRFNSENTPQSFAQAFSKACGFQRQSLWSLSAESETPLGEAQHFFALWWVLRAKPLTFSC